MESNVTAPELIRWVNQTILGTFNFLFSTAYFILILLLHCSKDKTYHNTFFTLFKVTGIYGIINMLTSSNSYWSFCESNRLLYVLRKQVNGIGSFCFITGCFLIEVQRFIVIRKSCRNENVISNRILSLIFVVQFIIAAAIMNIYTFAQVVYRENGCIAHMDMDHQVIISMVSTCFYCGYVILTTILTFTTISVIRTSEIMRHSINRRVLSLARYSIYCSSAQMLKGILQVIAIISMFSGNEFLTVTYFTLFYPVNLITVNSSMILLLIYSPSVRRLVAQMLCRLKEPTNNYVNGRQGRVELSLSQQIPPNGLVSVV